MKAEFVNPLVAAAFYVLGKITETNLEKKHLQLLTSPINAREVNTIIGVTGDLRGQVLIGMDRETAMNLASKMMNGHELKDFDEIAKSTVSELANMITGNATAGLAASGFNCKITPPTMFVGKNLVVSTNDIPFLVVSIFTKLGIVDLCIILKEEKNC